METLSFSWCRPTGPGSGRDLTIGQAEVDSLIRAKAAMYAILETLTEAVGVAFSDISTVFVAGAFGTLIRPESAVTIGMLPSLPPDRFVSLGNSSLEGAARVLQSPGDLSKVDSIRDRLTYLELNVNADFMSRFNAARFLPHTDLERFPAHRGSGRQKILTTTAAVTYNSE